MDSCLTFSPACLVPSCPVGSRGHLSQPWNAPRPIMSAHRSPKAPGRLRELCVSNCTACTASSTTLRSLCGDCKNSATMPCAEHSHHQDECECSMPKLALAAYRSRGYLFHPLSVMAMKHMKQVQSGGRVCLPELSCSPHCSFLATATVKHTFVSCPPTLTVTALPAICLYSPSLFI